MQLKLITEGSGSRALSRWVTLWFCGEKKRFYAISITFHTFLELFELLQIAKIQKSLKELNCIAPPPRVLKNQVQKKFKRLFLWLYFLNNLAKGC